MKKLIGLLGVALGASFIRNSRYSKLLVFSLYKSSSSSSSPFLNLGLWNFSLLSLFLSINLFKWLVFGSLTHKEVSMLYAKFNYTLWEFFLSLLVLRTVEPSKFSPLLISKFGFLFACVLLLKFFHYLCVYRVSNVFQSASPAAVLSESPASSTPFEDLDDLSQYNSNEFAYFDDLYLLNHQHASSVLVPLLPTRPNTIHYKTNPLTHLRFAMGILLLNFIDVVLIIKFSHEVQTKTDHNILLTLFGFEIINFYPLIILTSFNYILNYFEFRSNQILFKKFLHNVDNSLISNSLTPLAIIKTNYNKLLAQKNKNLINKKKNMVLFKFLINNFKLINQIIFSIFFLQHYTFPLHIMSYSYTSLRIFITKLRLLISLKQYDKKLTYIQTNLKTVDLAVFDSSQTCLICRTDFSSVDLVSNSDVPIKSLRCQHYFHEPCIVSWLMKSNCCPLCYTKV